MLLDGPGAMEEGSLVEDGPQEWRVLSWGGQGAEEAALPLALLPHSRDDRAPAEQVLPRLLSQSTQVTGMVRMVGPAQRLKEPGGLRPRRQGDPGRVLRVKEGSRDRSPMPSIPSVIGQAISAQTEPCPSGPRSCPRPCDPETTAAQAFAPVGAPGSGRAAPLGATDAV